MEKFPSYSELSKLLEKIRYEIKKSDTLKEIFKKAKVDLELLDLVPMCFSDLDVSARTEKGVIYFNYKLLEKPKQIEHYACHELTHWLDQCFSSGPTKGSDADNYLDNPWEQKGFKNQSKYISETQGDKEAEKYINKVLKHHDTPQDEMKERKKQLLQLAALIK